MILKWFQSPILLPIIIIFAIIVRDQNSVLDIEGRLWVAH